MRLGGFPSVLPALLAPAGEILRRHDPLLELRIMEVETVDAFELLLVGAVDIAITLPNLGGPTTDDPRFEQRPLLDEPQDLLVPVGHPMAGHDSVLLEEVAHEQWVLPAPYGCDQYELVAVACATAGFTPKIAHEAKEWSATIALVAHGFGVCLLPRLVPIASGLPVARVPLRDPVPRRRLLTATRRGSRGQRPIALGLAALAEAAARHPCPAAPVAQPDAGSAAHPAEVFGRQRVGGGEQSPGSAGSISRATSAGCSPVVVVEDVDPVRRAQLVGVGTRSAGTPLGQRQPLPLAAGERGQRLPERQVARPTSTGRASTGSMRDWSANTSWASSRR